MLYITYHNIRTLNKQGQILDDNVFLWCSFFLFGTNAVIHVGNPSVNTNPSINMDFSHYNKPSDL